MDAVVGRYIRGLAAVATALPTLSLAQLPPDSVRQFPGFVVSGTLVTPTGAPVARRTLYVFLFQDGQSYAQLGTVGGRTGPISPSAQTDAAGRFTIRVDSTYVRRHYGITEYTVGVYEGGRPLPLGLTAEAPMVFDLPLVVQSRYRVDLGRLLLRSR